MWLFALKVIKHILYFSAVSCRGEASAIHDVSLRMVSAADASPLVRNRRWRGVEEGGFGFARVGDSVMLEPAPCRQAF